MPRTKPKPANGNGRAPAQPKSHADRVQAVTELANKLGLDAVLVAVERQPSGDDGVGVVRLGGLRALELTTTLEIARAVAAQNVGLQQAPPAEASG